MLSPFHLNDWDFKRFAAVCLGVPFTLLILVGLSPLSADVLLTRYVVGTIYCIFIPGALILRVFRIHKLSAIESVSLMMGLSIAFVMFAGFVINLVYPQVGLSAPLSTIPVLVTFTACTLFLLIVCYFRDRDFSNAEHINIRDHISIPLLSLCLVPFLSIFGTYAVSYYNNNSLLLVLLCIIPLIILYVGFFQPSNKLIPIAVFVISIALLYQTSLMTSHLVGWDIQYESYISKVVIENAHWNIAIPATSYNTALSVTMLAPILSLLSGLDLTAVYKVIYPLLYTLVPLGLYEIYRRQTNERIAFFAVVFFVSSYTFFVIMPELAKQSIAEIFVVMFLLLIFNVQISGQKKVALLIISIFSITVSHYGVSYLFGLLLLTVLVGEYVKRIRAGRSASNQSYTPEGNVPALINKNGGSSYSRRKITSAFGLLYLLSVIAWYAFSANTSTFTSTATITQQISENLGQAFNPSVAQGASLLLSQQPSLLHEITWYLTVISEIAIVLGLAVCILKINKKRIDSTYVYFSIGAFGLLVASVALPYLGTAFNTIRIYHFALIFLSVFVVIGWVGITDFMRRAHLNVKPRYVTIWTKCFSIFLVVLFLFNTGMIYEIAHDNPQFPLNTSSNYPLFTDGDVSGATWLANTHQQLAMIGSDDANKQLLSSFGLASYNTVPNNNFLNGYIFFGHFNTEGIIKQSSTETQANDPVTVADINFAQTNLYRVYDNGDAQIYY